MRNRIIGLAILALLAGTFVFLACAGCGKEKVTDENGDLPEICTVYQVIDFTAKAANKWEEKNWVFQARDGDLDGVTEGKAKVWEAYYFSPRPEEDNQMLVIYNRGNVWPNTPGSVKGGEDGREAYRKEEPPAIRVDSPEAVYVANKNGGSEYLKEHPEAKVHLHLRCKADYTAAGDEMPAPGYKWIYDVYYREREMGSQELHVYVDGMSGDYISKEIEE